MSGTITAREVFLHGHTIIRLWGAAAYLACLRAALSRRSTTFLDVLCECGVVQPAGRIVRR